MLGMVYWGGVVPPHYQLSMNVATLLGSMIGQVCFGILADIYGRRKIYGLELLITILASLSFASASTGVFSSMSMIGWLIFWRIVMGIGIGADYPLSAVITAEFSPTRYRGRMIAAVFFCQPLGQMFATLTAYVATVGFRRDIAGIPQNDCSIHSKNQRNQDCARTVDQIWRLVAGLGAVPAILAIVSRLTIPESVRNLQTLDPGSCANNGCRSTGSWTSRMTRPRPTKPETTGLRFRILVKMRLQMTSAFRETKQQTSLRQDSRPDKKYPKRMEAVCQFILNLDPLVSPILLLEFKRNSKVVTVLKRVKYRVGPEIRWSHMRTLNRRSSHSVIFGYSSLVIRKPPRRGTGPTCLQHLSIGRYLILVFLYLA